ncbi:class I SAM-dependent methyltransferase [Isoptericola sp. BMS4]|uniref:class I SAM-dependent methyltransferase n=1 Tax=Isoptericola sp. BMS4 TaxID=2527875 RepID=UPI0014246F10|nr:class I SAM-dependent methyltransferase [Isoptericola sp. BMS4]
MTSHDVGAAYAARASEYVDLFGSVEQADDRDRRLVTRWADGLTGRVLDAGCGPGHWTRHLADLGHDVEGADLAEPFLEHARARHPGVPFRRAALDGLGVPDGSLGGVLAWYSVIHTSPSGMDAVLAELARALAHGGGLLLGFFSGPRVEPFDHAVTPAWYWPVAEMSARLTAAGFDVLESETRTDPGRRPHGAITARRAGGPPAPGRG